MAKIVSSPKIITAGVGRHNRDMPNRIRRPFGFPYWLLEYTAGGAAELEVKGGTTISGKDSIFLYEPGSRQVYENVDSREHWVHYWVCFQPRSDWLDWMNWPAFDDGLVMLHQVDLDVLKRVRYCFDELIRVLHGPLPHRGLLALAMLEQILLWCESANPKTDMQRLDERVQRAMAFICDHYREALTLEDIAEAAGISPSRLAHLFPQEVGITPMRYLEQHRIEIARQRLAGTSDSVTAIAERVGYGSASYFSKVFRGIQGCTPRDFRREALGSFQGS